MWEGEAGESSRSREGSSAAGRSGLVDCRRPKRGCRTIPDSSGTVDSGGGRGMSCVNL